MRREEIQGQYQAVIKQTVHILEDILDAVLSFYDQKWSLLLSSPSTKGG